MTEKHLARAVQLLSFLVDYLSSHPGTDKVSRSLVMPTFADIAEYASQEKFIYMNMQFVEILPHGKMFLRQQEAGDYSLFLRQQHRHHSPPLSRAEGDFAAGVVTHPPSPYDRTYLPSYSSNALVVPGTVRCALHGKDRTKSNMVEVTPGRWECPRAQPCQGTRHHTPGFSSPQENQASSPVFRPAVPYPIPPPPASMAECTKCRDLLARKEALMDRVVEIEEKLAHLEAENEALKKGQQDGGQQGGIAIIPPSPVEAARMRLLKEENQSLRQKLSDMHRRNEELVQEFEDARRKCLELENQKKRERSPPAITSCEDDVLQQRRLALLQKYKKV